MSYRYFIDFAYKGTAYCGWQRQPNGVAVQEVLARALSTILRSETEPVAAGRTDAGVHARNMTAHFDCNNPIEDLERLRSSLNSLLPRDIAVNRIVRVRDSAHARFDALSRKYEYRIALYKSPFLDGLAAYVHYPLDLDAMNRAARVLFRYRDFTSFSKVHTDVRTNDCTIMEAEWRRDGDEIVFTVKANRFLRNMVRAIVGTLLDVGRGKLTEDDVARIIERRDRCAAGHSVPACGLYFLEAEYPQSVFEVE